MKQQLLVLGIAALIAVVILALFGKEIRVFGLRVSWKDGITITFEKDKNNAGDPISNNKKEVKNQVNQFKESSPSLGEPENSWPNTNTSVSPLPTSTDPPINKLQGKQFMSDEYTSLLISSLETNIQPGDFLSLDDGMTDKVEEC
jgi:hypothetical protein